MQVIWKPWARKALDQTEAAAARVGQVLSEGAAAAQVRTEIALEKARLQRKAKGLRDAIARHLQTVGSLVYATHCGHPTDSDDLQRLLEYIDQLQKELKLVEEELRAVETAVPFATPKPLSAPRRREK